MEPKQEPTESFVSAECVKAEVIRSFPPLNCWEFHNKPTSNTTCLKLTDSPDFRTSKLPPENKFNSSMASMKTQNDFKLGQLWN